MTNEQLVARIKAGEDVDINMLQLYEQVKRFIHAIAWKYQESGEMEDLEQEGYLALYPAIDGYDPEQGVKFLTYAEYHIKQRMRRYLLQNGSLLRIPAGQYEKIRKYKKSCNTFQLKHGREPLDWEMASLMGVSLERVRGIQEIACMAALASLDSPVTGIDGGKDTVAGDLVPSDEDMEWETLERLDHEHLCDVLWDCVGSLEGRQPDVIRRRFRDRETFQNIGDEWGTTAEEVRKQESKALRELRRPSISNRLRPFLPECDRIYSMALVGNGVERFNRTWTSSTELVALKLNG